MPDFPITPSLVALAGRRLRAAGITDITYDGRETLTVGAPEATAAPILAALGEHEARAEDLVARVHAGRDALLSAGYVHDFGGDIGAHRFDSRDVEDRANWLALHGLWSALDPDDPVSIVTADNAVLEVTAGTAADFVLAMGQWHAAIVIAARRTKSALLAAGSTAEIDAIDLAPFVT